MDQSLGALNSPYDPVILSLGDVAFDVYQGNSLHVLAAGDVTVPRYIQVFGPAGAGEDAIVETDFQLSNGISFPIDGRSESTVDIRAGVDPDVIRTFGNVEQLPATGDFFGSLGFTPPPVDSANIDVGTILFGTILSDPNNPTVTEVDQSFAAGRALLTNNYRPDADNLVAGNIAIRDSLTGTLSGGSDVQLDGIAIRNNTFQGGGNVAIDSRGDITLQGAIRAEAIATGTDSAGLPIYNAGANGGDVTLLSTGNILFTNGTLDGDRRTGINSTGQTGGDINLSATGNITFDPFSAINSSSNNSDNILDFSTIRIESTSGSVSINGSEIQATNTGSQFAGDIFIDAGDRIDMTNGSLISADGNFGRIFIGSTSSDLTSDTTVPNAIAIDNSRLTASNGIIDGTENAGNITLRSQNISMSNQAILSTTTFGPLVSITDTPGNGGDIDIFSQALSLTDGSEILSLTLGAGNAGDITVQPLNPDAPSSVSISGVAPSSFEFVTQPDGTMVLNPTGDFSSGLISGTEIRPLDLDSDGVTELIDTTGNGGNISVTTSTLTLADGGVISARTNSLGDGQNITINVDRLDILNGGQILTASIFSDPNGTAGRNVSRAGDIFITASEGVFVSGYDATYNGRFSALEDNFILVGESLTSAFQQTRQTIDPVRANSGIQATDVFGFGEAGNITIEAPVIELSDLANISSILVTASRCVNIGE
ncbi:MAG: hypothetical protein F6K09_16805, partial [Merismopedia sp. SIO2A8]|nr:hypothetical protein [Merismopedia sp. SIO2A8]